MYRLTPKTRIGDENFNALLPHGENAFEEAFHISILELEKEILEKVAKQESSSSILDAIVNKIEVISSDMKCSIFLLDKKGNKLRLGSAPHLPKEYNDQFADGVPIGPNIGSCGTAAYMGKVVIVSDIENDLRWKNYKHLALKHGLRSCWSAPVKSLKYGVVGTFAMYYEERRHPTAYELALIHSAAKVTGIAYEQYVWLQEVDRSQEMAISESQKKDFWMAALSHDFRSPLNAILGFSEILARFPLSDSEKEKYYQRIQNNGRILLDLVENILSARRFSGGEITCENAVFNVRELLNEVSQLFAERVKSKGIYLDVEIADGVPEQICSDRSHLRQILMNLLGNAVKFTSTGGVNVDVEMENACLKIFVKDTGIGIPLDRQDVVFEPFTQGNKQIKNTFGGSGLGLSIVKSLVEALGGKIKLLESTPGQGTCFGVWLPVG